MSNETIHSPFKLTLLHTQIRCLRAFHSSRSCSTLSMVFLLVRVLIHSITTVCCVNCEFSIKKANRRKPTASAFTAHNLKRQVAQVFKCVFQIGSENANRIIVHSEFWHIQIQLATGLNVSLSTNYSLRLIDNSRRCVRCRHRLDQLFLQLFFIDWIQN